MKIKDDSGCPPDTPPSIGSSGQPLERKPVGGSNQRSDREARQLHAERKGGKLGGNSQQKTIRELLDNLKKKKNPPEVHKKLEFTPERGGG